MAREVSWLVRSQPSLQCTTTEVFPDSTLSAIRSAPARISYEERKEKKKCNQGSPVNGRDPAVNLPWYAQASEWTPDWRASGNPQCWGRPHPLTCGATLSSRGCCECPRKPAQHSDRRPHFRNLPLSSEENSTDNINIETRLRLSFWTKQLKPC